MRRTVPAVLAAVLFAAAPAPADLYGGTDCDTIAAGGSFFFDPDTVDGGDFSLELHGGYYLCDSFLAGGSFSARDSDVADTYEIAVLGQFHWFRLLDPENDRPYGLSPYAGIRLGAARGKDAAGSDLGALAGLRVGLDVFFTDNVVLDLAFDWSVCSAKVYPDDYHREKSDLTLRLGFDFHF